MHSIAPAVLNNAPIESGICRDSDGCSLRCNCRSQKGHTVRCKPVLANSSQPRPSPGPAQAQPRPSPGPALAQPRPSPGPAQAQPRPSPGASPGPAQAQPRPSPGPAQAQPWPSPGPAQAQAQAQTSRRTPCDSEDAERSAPTDQTQEECHLRN